MKTRFIVNLRSGRASKALPSVQEFARHYHATVVLTERPRHAADLATRAVTEGCELIVAVGGDGTMNEIAGTLVGTPATLGLVPCGSGDGLGRHLGIHGSIPRALQILVTGRPRLIDSGDANGHPFFTVAGIGFEAEIAQRFNQLKRRGFLRYLSTSARAFLGWRPQEFTLTHRGARTTFRCFTLAVANANQYGNDALIAPAAAPDDGQLDLCAIPPLTCGNAVPLLVHLFRGTIEKARGVQMHRGERFTLERASAGPLHTDGEVHPAGTTIEFIVRPASLRVMAPG